MTDYVAAMNTGLSVLKAISDKVKPASDDVEERNRQTNYSIDRN
jgi:hypothetical protein